MILRRPSSLKRNEAGSPSYAAETLFSSKFASFPVGRHETRTRGKDSSPSGVGAILSSLVGLGVAEWWSELLIVQAHMEKLIIRRGQRFES